MRRNQQWDPLVTAMVTTGPMSDDTPVGQTSDQRSSVYTAGTCGLGYNASITTYSVDSVTANKGLQEATCDVKAKYRHTGLTW